VLLVHEKQTNCVTIGNGRLEVEEGPGSEAIHRLSKIRGNAFLREKKAMTGSGECVKASERDIQSFGSKNNGDFFPTEAFR